MLRALMALITNDDGQTMAEYGLILALIAIVVILALVFLGGRIAAIFNRVGENLNVT